MNDKSSIEKWFVRLAPYLIGLATLLLVFGIIQLTKTSNKVSETAAYTRVTNCIVSKASKPPIADEDVEICYVEVEKETNVGLRRFDKQ